MKPCYILALSALLPLSSCGQGNGSAGLPPMNQSVPVPLGDPFILLDGDTYYAYGTHADEGIEVYTSPDLKVWTKAGLALHRNDVWADRWFWAPEVYRSGSLYYMYYSADEHICVATASSPLGPFVQEDFRPMLPDEKAIDNSLFIDDDGTPYLVFDRFNDGLNVWIAELESDLMTLRTETLHPCIHMSQDWERIAPTVNEGPFILKHLGVYHMTYSANSYESPSYGIGCATTSDLMGEWTKYPDNPILQFPGDLVGTGHGAFFTDKEGHLRYVFHAHHDRNNIHPRSMYITDASFETGSTVDRLRISPGYFMPALKIP
ncbi:MAG: glycoside hydrolase family 43 protein [Bacteroidales bacterium]|nr:glycoside hydrolase family 43 protein [Bacteroidales bacterium]